MLILHLVKQKLERSKLSRKLGIQKLALENKKLTTSCVFIVVGDGLDFFLKDLYMCLIHEVFMMILVNL